MLRPSGDFAIDADLCQRGLNRLDRVLDVLFAIDALGRQQTGDALVVVRIEIAKTPVFQFPFELPDTESIGERGVDFARFRRDALALGGWGIAAFAQQVQLRRQLDQHQSRIGDDGQQHLAQRFGLLR